MTTITILTDSYNERRYGKPWIAKVNFSADPKGAYTWGDWIGDHRNGGAGTLSILANPGDIIAEGQKDNRNPRNSAATFHVVTTSGELESIGDKGDAYKHFLAAKAPGINHDALAAEKEKLLARIAEIDSLLEKSDYCETDCNCDCSE